MSSIFRTRRWSLRTQRWVPIFKDFDRKVKVGEPFWWLSVKTEIPQRHPESLVHVLRFASSSFFPPCAASTAAMKLRSGRTTVTTALGFGDGDGDGGDMNPSLWGELQRFIDLSVIYAKLPLAPFFRLRQVCKDWNRLASDRQFLELNFKPPISNLYFVVAQRTGHRLWTSQDSMWTSSPLPRSPCEVSGLLYEDSDRNCVFNLHTRVFYSLPPLPPPRLGTFNWCPPMVLMTVDTSLIPYGFRVFIIKDFEINIYESNSNAWTQVYTITYLSLPWRLSCVHDNKFLYMLDTTEGGRYVLKYDLEKNIVRLKQFQHCQCQWKYAGIGMWQDRMFAFAMKPKSVLTAWEMNTSLEEPWIVFDCMPKLLCEWMMMDLGHQNVITTLCGEHVLVYNCLEAQERAVLYNLERKTWNKMKLVKNL